MTIPSRERVNPLAAEYPGFPRDKGNGESERRCEDKYRSAWAQRFGRTRRYGRDDAECGVDEAARLRAEISFAEVMSGRLRAPSWRGLLLNE